MTTPTAADFKALAEQFRRLYVHGDRFSLSQRQLIEWRRNLDGKGSGGAEVVETLPIPAFTLSSVASGRPFSGVEVSAVAARRYWLTRAGTVAGGLQPIEARLGAAE